MRDRAAGGRRGRAVCWDIWFRRHSGGFYLPDRNLLFSLLDLFTYPLVFCVDQRPQGRFAKMSERKVINVSPHIFFCQIDLS